MDDGRCWVRKLDAEEGGSFYVVIECGAGGAAPSIRLTVYNGEVVAEYNGPRANLRSAVNEANFAAHFDAAFATSPATGTAQRSPHKYFYSLRMHAPDAAKATAAAATGAGEGAVGAATAIGELHASVMLSDPDVGTFRRPRRRAEGVVRAFSLLLA